MCKMVAPLVGFTENAIPIKGVIELPVIVGKPPAEATAGLEFLVVRFLSTYNVILERPGLNVLRVVISTYHLLIKFPTRARVREI